MRIIPLFVLIFLSCCNCSRNSVFNDVIYDRCDFDFDYLIFSTIDEYNECVEVITLDSVMFENVYDCAVENKFIKSKYYLSGYSDEYIEKSNLDIIYKIRKEDKEFVYYVYFLSDKKTILTVSVIR